MKAEKHKYLGPGKGFLFLPVLAMLFLALPVLAAEVTITGVKVDRDGSSLVLAVGLSGPAEPRVFSIDNKGPNPRVVIDFNGAKAVRLPSQLDSPSLLAKSVRVGRHSDKIRIVIDLYPKKTYLVEQFYAEQEKQYLLRLSTAKTP